MAAPSTEIPHTSAAPETSPLSSSSSSQTLAQAAEPTEKNAVAADKEGQDMAAAAAQQPSSSSPYPGAGTKEDPYVVSWLGGEQQDPYNWKKSYKWFQTLLTAIDTLCIAFASAAYTGGASEIEIYFKVKEIIVISGVTVFVVGFGAGPLLWAPFSEMYGRRNVFVFTYALFTLFHLGGALAKNIETVIITRFFCGFFGSAPLTNSGGTIADMWSAKERGTASAFFALAPFLGPVLGPIIGGFAAQYGGWRSVFWVMFGFAGVTYIVSFILVPETYAPVLLRNLAKKLQKESGGQVYYISKYDKMNTKTSAELLKINMSRPFVLLFKEPIVLLFSTYTAIIYGSLYLFFTAFPIVFQLGRGWGSGLGGLAFLGVGLGMCIGTALAPVNQMLYNRAVAKSPDGRAPPEARLPMAMIGSVCIPVSIFWFAWTSYPSVYFLAPIFAGVPFGCGMLLVFSSVINYLIDVYLLYAASALAANAVMRSLLGAVFPLFSSYMYHNLGDEWASTLVAFLSLACVPMPFLFYRYGPQVRAMSTFSPTGKAPAAPAAPAPAPEPPVQQVEPVPNLDPEFGADAGMVEQRDQEAELERRKTGEKIV